MNTYLNASRTCVLTAAIVCGLAGMAAGQAGTAVPEAPTKPSASVDRNGRVHVVWVDNSGNETGFAIDRVPAFPQGAMVIGPDITEFNDVPGHGEFSYTITAINEGGRSAPTEPVSVRVKNGKVGPHDGRPGTSVRGSNDKPKRGGGDSGGSMLAPPTPPTITVSVQGTTAKVRWGDGGGNAEGYELIREVYIQGNWRQATGRMLPPLPAELSEPGLGYGTYRYKVRALNSVGVSAFTSWAVAVVTPPPAGQAAASELPQAPAIPAAPSGVAASDFGNGRAMVTWSDNSTNETGFKVEREPAFASGEVTVGAGATAYVDQCGAGVFRYRVRSFNTAGSSAASGWAQVQVAGPAGGGGNGGGGGAPAGTVGPDGWTVFAASSDTRTIYVSSSTGNDSNSGLTEGSPKRTIAAAYSLMRDGYPDWMLLKSGDTWYERFPTWSKSGRSTSEMMRVAAYGSGERPRLMTGTDMGLDANSSGSQRGHVAFTDIHFKAHTYDGSNGSPYGLSLLGNWKDVLVENCKFEAYFVNAALQGFNGDLIRDIRVRRNVLVDAYKVGTEGHAQGLIIGHCDGGLVEENVLDHNGWSETVAGASPTIFRHNVYINPDNTTNMVTRGNIVARGAASGLRSCGNLSEYNLCLANPVNLIGAANTRIIRFNTVMDSRDIGPNNPIGTGIVGVYQDCEIYGNIVAYRTPSDSFNLYAIQLGAGTRNTNVHNNVVYKWNGPSTSYGQALLISGDMFNVTVRNNIFEQAGGGRVAWAEPASPLAPSFSGNRYFSTSPSPFATPGPSTIWGATYQQWLSATSEMGSAWGAAPFPYPNRTIATYMQSLGQTPSMDGFLTEARKQSKSNWRQEFTARAAGDYFREGFGVVIQMP